MNDAVAMVVIAFASYRLTRLVTTDDITEPLRRLWFRPFPLETKPGIFISCPYCAGFWVTLIVLALAHAVQVATWPIKHDAVILFGVTGAQALLNAVDQKLDG